MAKKLSVQAQNEKTLTHLLAVASKVRSEGLPEGAAKFLSAHGIDLSTSAVVFLRTESNVLCLDYGIAAFIVTADARIWDVELELDASMKNVLNVLCFKDVTSAQNTSQHNPGYGWGWGALAIEAMKRLNDN